MKYTIRLLGFIVALCICLIILEIVLRITMKNIDNQLAWTASPNYRLDSELIYSRLPNKTWVSKTDEFEEKVTSDNLGYRDKNIGEKGEDVFRIIAVGDSFTFGHGVENNDKTYPKQLELYLTHYLKINKKIEVINVAEKGYSPDQEYRQIQKRLIQLSPDMILWNFSIPGDLYNLIQDPGWPVPSLYDVDKNQLKELNARYNWLYISNYFRYHFPFLNNSYLFNTVVRNFSTIKAFSRKPSMSDEKMMDWAVKKMVLEVEETQKIAYLNKFRLFITFLPYPESFGSEYQNSIIAKKINEFKQELDTKKISVIDVKEQINSNLSTINKNLPEINNILGVQDFSVASLYYKKDYHPNKTGAYVFALIVGNNIKQNLIPTK